VNSHLREILQEESQNAHDFTEYNGLFGNLDIVVDAKTVKNSGQEHVFSDKADLGISFKVWKRVVKVLTYSGEPNQLSQGVDKHENDESGYRDSNVPFLTLN